jgi:FkbM family methyltransferase
LTWIERHPLARTVYHRVAPWLFRRRRRTFRIGDTAATFVLTTPAERDRTETLVGERAVLQAMLDVIEPGDVVYDVGANIGTHSCLFADRVGEQGLVVAVEPDSTNCTALHRNIRANGFERRVAVVPYAVGRQRGFADLHLGGYMPGTGTHSLVSTRAGAGAGGLDTVSVPVVTLDSLTKVFGGPAVVKIDVEGAESDVLAGGTETVTSAEHVFVEEHDTRELDGEVIAERGVERFVKLRGQRPPDE